MSKGKRTVIVTGANCGLGFESTKYLLSDKIDEWHVVLACRDESKGKQAIQQIVEIDQEYASRLTFIELDLADLDSVRNFVTNFNQEKLPPLKALICNAATQAPPNISTTKQGYDIVFGVNHLGHFLLTNLLIPHFAKNDEINSIVNVTSDTHDPKNGTPVPVPTYGPVDKLIIPPQETPKRDSRYATSKLCNILFTYELKNRLDKSDEFKNHFRVNCFNPGFMPETSLARYLDPKLFNMIVEGEGKKYRKPIANSSRYLADLVNPQLDKVSNGVYYDGNEIIPSSDESYEVSKQLELWEGSKNLIKTETDFIL
ncbi:predicted protein [Naegleria gruberi]|uniref:Predicted protein n=1 Tax=Naegleria gruberi TaxID=5762 RepID=D2VTF6_NAEGR|nr:uncharacterized protein NAEGRDRAFT_72282 [Naegleria gruberi]EFC39924.1 predicted protein [Naegleria gruberi]|eukprot:XP_002672668.1 predicted protein [Naegleria gruberi strain NEG-M]